MITNDILENDYGIIKTRGEKFEVRRNIFCFTGSDGKIENRSVEHRSNICQLLREALCLTSTLDSQRHFATNTDAGLVLEGRNEVQVPLAAQNTCHDTCKRDRNATLCRVRRTGITRGNVESSFL